MGSQRFLTFKLGENDKEGLKDVFSTTLLAHIFLAILIVTILGFGGSWLIDNQLKIDPTKQYVAQIILYITLAPIFFNIANAPYNGMVMAQEHMSVYAYFSIFEVSSKLMVAFIILHAPENRLILFSSLTGFVSCISALVPIVYSHRKFPEARLLFRYKSKYLKEILSFSGWNIVSNLSYTLSTNGLSIVLNMFFGTVINAAGGIATRVSVNVERFVNNFMMAVNPQIIKYYASGNKNEMYKLAQRTVLYGGFLFMFFAIPLNLELHFVLKVWLDQVPQYTMLIVYILMIKSLISLLLRPLSFIIQASGKMKWSQLTISLSQLPMIFVSYAILKITSNLTLGLLPVIFFSIINLYIHLYFVSITINISKWDFFKRILLKFLGILLLSSILPAITHSILNEGWTRLLAVTISSIVSTVICVYFLGITKKDKVFVLQKIVKKFKS